MKWDPVPPLSHGDVLAAVSALGFEVLDHSHQARPIVGRRFGGPGAPLLVLGGIHGDEPSGVAAVVELAGRLELAGRPEVAGRPELDRADGGELPPLWLIPLVNPDGVAAGTKNSARDVDLNRNFPARSFSARDYPAGYFPGPAPLSEPETRLVAQLVEGTGPGDLPASGIVAVHAPFACVNYDGPAAAWAEGVAAACGWPARADLGYPTPGSLGSWFGRDRGLPILTLELPPGPLADFRQAAAAALDAAIGLFPRPPLPAGRR